MKNSSFGMIKSRVRLFADNQRGNVAIMTAFVLPAIALGAGVAVDYSSLYMARTELQQMADGSALAAAKGMVLINKERLDVDEIAKRFLVAHLKSGKSKFAKIEDLKVKVDDKNNILTVSVTASKRNMFGNFLQPEYSFLTVTAKAKALSGVNVCVIGLDENKEGTIKMEDNAQLIGNKCGVYSNSVDSESIELHQNSNLQSSLICSSGGIKKTDRSRSSPGVTDCPPIDDPLTVRATPYVGSCDHTNYSRNNKFGFIWPGTYCGGLKIGGNSVVNFMPGIYIIKDGPLEIKGRTVAAANYVGFYFTGNEARMILDEDTTIDFVAPRSGIMAGMLFFQNPVGPLPSNDDDDNESGTFGRFDIKSNNARTLLGTIYLPRGKLFVKSENPVADESAFTVVVAKRMQFYGDSKLILNSDYSATDVPVPEGIVGEGAKVFLTK